MVSSKIILGALLAVVVAVTALPHDHKAKHHTSLVHDVHGSRHPVRHNKDHIRSEHHKRRRSSFNVLARAFGHGKCGNAGNFFLELGQGQEKNSKQIDPNLSLRILSNAVRGVCGVGSQWVEGLGEKILHLVFATLKINLCHEPTRKRIGIDLRGINLEICDANYGTEWGLPRCDSNEPSKVILVYKLKNILADIETLHKSKGSKFNHATEKMLWTSVKTFASLYSKSCEKWTIEDFSVVFSESATFIGGLGAAYKNVELGEQLIDDFQEQFSGILRFLKLKTKIDASVKECKLRIAQCTRINLNGALIDYDGNDDDNDDDNVGVNNVINVGNNKNDGLNRRRKYYTRRTAYVLVNGRKIKRTYRRSRSLFSLTGIFRKRINHSKCGKAVNYFTKDTVHSKKIDKSNLKERFDYTLQRYFGLTLAVGDLNNGWIKDAGALYTQCVRAFLQICSCDKDISARLLPGVPQNLQVCSENYGVKEFGWKAYTSKYTRSKDIIEFYSLKKVSTRLSKLLEAHTKGKGLTHVTEKRAWQCMVDTAAVLDKPSDQWTKADVEIVITGVIDLVGIHAAAIKNWKYADVVTSKYCSQFKPLIKIAGININKYRKDSLVKLKTCTRYNFNEVSISNQDDNDDDDDDDDDEYITETTVKRRYRKRSRKQSSKSFSYFVRILNKKQCSRARTYFSLISQSQRQYRNKYNDVDVDTSLDNVARLFSAVTDLLNGWKAGSGDYYLRLSRGVLGCSVCYKPLCSRLAPKLYKESRKICSKGYGSKDLGWNTCDTDYKSISSIIKVYGLKDITKKYDVLFKDYEKSSTCTKSGKRLITYIGNTKKLFEVDVENWTKNDIFVYYKNLLNIFYTLTINKTNKKEVTRQVNEYVSFISSLTRELNIKTELQKYVTTEITTETTSDDDDDDYSEFSKIWRVKSTNGNNDGTYDDEDDDLDNADDDEDDVDVDEDIDDDVNNDKTDTKVKNVEDDEDYSEESYEDDEDDVSGEENDEGSVEDYDNVDRKLRNPKGNTNRPKNGKKHPNGDDNDNGNDDDDDDETKNKTGNKGRKGGPYKPNNDDDDEVHEKVWHTRPGREGPDNCDDNVGHVPDSNVKKVPGNGDDNGPSPGKKERPTPDKKGPGNGDNNVPNPGSNVLTTPDKKGPGNGDNNVPNPGSNVLTKPGKKVPGNGDNNVPNPGSNVLTTPDKKVPGNGDDNGPSPGNKERPTPDKKGPGNNGPEGEQDDDSYIWKFSRRVSTKTCRGASRRFDYLSRHRKSVSTLDESVTSFFYGLDGIRIMTNRMVSGSGDLFSKLVQAIWRYAICNKQKTVGRKGIIPSVCTKSYGVKNLGWKEYTENDYEYSSITKYYGIDKNVESVFEKLLKESTKGAGLKNENEKAIWDAMINVAKICKKSKWTVDDYDETYKSFLTMFAWYSGSYNSEYVSQIIDEFDSIFTQLKNELVISSRVTKSKTVIIKKAKTCSRYGFNSILTEQDEVTEYSDSDDNSDNGNNGGNGGNNNGNGDNIDGDYSRTRRYKQEQQKSANEKSAASESKNEENSDGSKKSYEHSENQSKGQSKESGSSGQEKVVQKGNTLTQSSEHEQHEHEAQQSAKNSQTQETVVDANGGSSFKSSKSESKSESSQSSSQTSYDYAEVITE